MWLLSTLLAYLCAFRVADALGQQPVVSFKGDKGSLKLAGAGSPPGSIILDANDWPGVLRAGQDLAIDFGRVTGTNLTRILSNGTVILHDCRTHLGNGGIIIAGTIGRSQLIGSLIDSGKINVTLTEGK